MNLKDAIIQAADLPEGNSLFIPVEHRLEQKAMAKELRELAKEYSERIDPLNYFMVKETFKDQRLWIIVQKLPHPKAFWEKGPDGVTKHPLVDPRRGRLEKQMLEDGIPPKERERLLGGILETEDPEQGPIGQGEEQDAK